VPSGGATPGEPDAAARQLVNRVAGADHIHRIMTGQPQRFAAELQKGRIPMKVKMIASILALTMLSAVMCMADDDDEKKRQKTRKMAAEALQDLYKLEPTSQAAIQKATGYAVFDNMGMNVLLLSTARGSGLAVNNKTKQETFMKMGSAGVGVGMGVKDYVVVFVFENEKVLAQFLDSGWSGSGQADAAAKAGEKGGAYSGAAEVAPGVWVYQITKNGLALQLTLQGTKYYKDKDLNEK
jgi:lipid-binding SYLF domain-containing protein